MDRGKGSGAAPFVPPAGNILWLDATDGASPAVWLDKSGGHRDFPQPTGAARPTIVTGINGLQCVNTVMASIQHYDGPNFLQTTTAGHLFMVFRSTIAPGNYSGFWQFGTSGVGDIVPLFDNNYYLDYGSTTRRMIVPAVDARVAQLLEIVTTASEWTMLQNGVQVFTTPTNTVAWSTAPKIGFSASNDACSALWAEKLLFNQKLIPSDAALVRTYLKTKWGTP